MIRNDDAVSPVVGTVMILLITMAGIGAVLAWGVPSIRAIQDQSALAAMEGELAGVRANTVVLKEADTSRLPGVRLVEGELGVQPGSRFAFHVIHNDTFPDLSSAPNCDVRVTGWEDTSDTLVVDVDSCGTVVTGNASAASDELEFGLAQMIGSSIQSRPSINVTDNGDGTWSITSSGDELSENDWRLRMVDADDDVHVQVFILGTDRIVWKLDTAVTNYRLHLEGAAMFRQDGLEFYNLVSPRVNEDVVGSGDYLLQFPSYNGPYTSITSPSDPRVFLQLQGNKALVVGQDTLRLRYDVSGDLAEAWCNTWLLRNLTVDAGNYDEDPDATCAEGDAAGVRSVQFEPTSSFPFEFIHGRVRSEVVL